MQLKQWWKYKGLAYLFAIILISGAINHIFSPELYAPFVPNWVSLQFANLFATITEALVGILLCIKSTRRIGFLAFAVLMIGFLPLHIWDVFKEEPALFNPFISFLRLLLQVYLIYIGWKMWKVLKPKQKQATHS